MAPIEIVRFPAPVLREVAKPIENITDDIRCLAEQMLESMHRAKGAGLAANQVGVPIRLIVLDAQSKNVKKVEKRHLILLNPIITEAELEETLEEGCLSLPRYYDFIKRAKRVLVTGYTLDERPFEMECEGFLARAFQHEIDHLNGILFIDHLSPVKKGIFKKQYLKGKR
jgi:peptide deformylase